MSDGRRPTWSFIIFFGEKYNRTMRGVGVALLLVELRLCLDHRPSCGVDSRFCRL
jgi:hypothetical protein